MTNTTKTLHDEKVKSLADKYVSAGFRVLINPKTDELPFDLGNYQPDIIAIKDNSGLVIEIRTSLSRISVERLKALGEEVSKHPGWRFLLVTLEDTEDESLPGTLEQLPSWQELTDRFAQARRLIEKNEIEPAFLFLWSIFEGALRKRALDISIPIESFPAIGLLRQLYSLGELSISQFDLAESCFKVRSRIVHGYIENLSLQCIHDFDTLVGELFSEWSADSHINQVLENLMDQTRKDYQSLQEIFVSELWEIDKEKKDKILRNLKQRLEKKGLNNFFNDFQRLIDESFDPSIEFNNQESNKNKVVLLDKAQIALDALPNQERENVLDVIKCLEEFPSPMLESQKLKSIPDYFIATAGIYRIVFEFKPEKLTIIDIVNRNRLEFLYETSKKAEA